MVTLSEEVLNEQLAMLDGWTRNGNELVKTFTLRNFPAAIAFVTQVGFLAEAMIHHPNIDIRYRRVTLTLSTHDAGGLTEKDLVLARAVDGLTT